MGGEPVERQVAPDEFAAGDDEDSATGFPGRPDGLDDGFDGWASGGRGMERVEVALLPLDQVRDLRDVAQRPVEICDYSLPGLPHTATLASTDPRVGHLEVRSAPSRGVPSMKTFLSLIATAVIAVAGVVVAKDQGWIGSESSDTQVVQAVERTQEVSLLRLSVQGIKTTPESRDIFGIEIPGTTRTQFLQYKFRAKLGIDGTRVKLQKTGEKSFRVSVPEFIFIGYDKPTFKVAVEDGGVLSWLTPEINTDEVITEILNDKAQQAYVEENAELLKDQTQVFYESLIHAIDPQISTTFEFR